MVLSELIAIAARCLFAILLCCGVLSAQRRVEVEGEVKNGDTFTKAIGHGLLFALRPLASGGYAISIEPEHSDTAPSDDFTRCVTGPAHGSAPTELDPAQFVPGGDTSGDQFKGVKEREFQFVTNAADQKKACSELTRCCTATANATRTMTWCWARETTSRRHSVMGGATSSRNFVTRQVFA